MKNTWPQIARLIKPLQEIIADAAAEKGFDASATAQAMLIAGMFALRDSAGEEMVQCFLASMLESLDEDDEPAGEKVMERLQ